jgi:GNAT superfamily N-acetyltransferase
LPAHDISEGQFVRKVLLDSNFDPEGAFVARDAGGSVAGFLLSIARKPQLESGPNDLHRGWITLFAVRNDARRCSIGSQMFDAADNLLRAKQANEIWISPYTPNYWTPGVDEAAYPAAREFLKKRGYEVASRPLSMAVDLTSSWSATAWAARREGELGETLGLHISPITSTTALPLMQFLAKEFPGDWQRHVRDSITAIYSGQRHVEDVQVAMCGGNVWGFSHIEGERFGPFGVADSRRGLGVGAALLYRSLESMRRRGSKRAWFMWTGDGPAKRVYAPAGFIETNRYAVMVKRLT